jgi:hypothetical protein
VKKYLVALLFVAAISAASFGWIIHHKMEPRSLAWDDVVPENSITGDVDFELNARELEVNFKRAQQGDALAARYLSYHFGAVGSESERLKWLIAAGTAGDCPSILNLEYEKAVPQAQNKAWSETAKRLKCDPEKEFGITVRN